MKIHVIMTKSLDRLTRGAPMQTAGRKIRQADVRGRLVEENNKLVGMITDSVFVTRILGNDADVTSAQVRGAMSGKVH